MKQLILIFSSVLSLGFSVTLLPDAQAFLTPHPIKVYDKGHALLGAYDGDDRMISDAQALFNRIIVKHPDSPFGYLGMSEAKIIEAYQYDQRYNMKIITEEALPMALKAMRNGPTINRVHDNYDRFERLMQENDKNQEQVRQKLFMFPERPETYLSLGNYLGDQGDYNKALEYYRIALRFASTDEMRLQASQRIAWVYMEKLSDPGQAVEYLETALKIRGDLAVLREYLGTAYLQLQQYRPSVDHLAKAAEIFQTPALRARLLEAQGLLYKEQGNVDLAISSISSSLHLNNHNTALHYYLGVLYYGKKDYENAYQHFAKVIAAGLTDADALYLAGRAAGFSGREAAAREYYAQYLELKDDGQEADWIRRNIPDLSRP